MNATDLSNPATDSSGNRQHYFSSPTKKTMALPARSSGLTVVVSRLLLLVQVVVHCWWFPYPSVVHAGVPVPSQFYTQQSLDHTSTDSLLAQHSNGTWTQRYYTYPEYFAGPGSPIFVIFGGEGAIEPTTGIMYPFVAQHLARAFGAMVLQPEHRFYGASQPMDPATIHQWRAAQPEEPDPRAHWLSYEQALGDAVQLLNYLRGGDDNSWGCSTDRHSDDYCPVIAVGGSYPGFLAAMARIAHPNVFDMAYAASAPMKFYAQQLSRSARQSAYYDHIAAVAERAVPGCRAAVQSTLRQVQHLFDNNDNNTVDPSDVGVCPGTVPDYSGSLSSTFLDELHMMIGYTFANMNMAYYPPSNRTALHRACVTFLDDSLSAVERVRTVLVRELAQSPSTCFDMAAQRPGGPHATISAGDWSGVGTGQSGESWDFQTCTYCVESIGFNATSSGMFLDRPWSLDWLTRHCQSRFAVTPDPYQINRRWGIDNLLDKANASYILFTNGLNDGWSVSGIRDDLSETVLALNFPNGAHHSDLSGVGPTDHDTIDIQTGFLQVRTILAAWLAEIRASESSLAS